MFIAIGSCLEVFDFFGIEKFSNLLLIFMIYDVISEPNLTMVRSQEALKDVERRPYANFLCTWLHDMLYLLESGSKMIQ